MNNNLEFENEDPSPDSIEDNHPRTNYGEGFTKQERSYSEEDMKQAYLDGCKIKLTNIYHLEKWFEQFKKK